MFDVDTIFMAHIIQNRSAVLVRSIVQARDNFGFKCSLKSYPNHARGNHMDLRLFNCLRIRCVAIRAVSSSALLYFTGGCAVLAPLDVNRE